jgi:hypothetical protein
VKQNKKDKKERGIRWGGTNKNTLNDLPTHFHTEQEVHFIHMGYGCILWKYTMADTSAMSQSSAVGYGWMTEGSEFQSQ